MNCRYVINANRTKKYSNNKNFENSCHTIPYGDAEKIFVDILEKHDFTYKVRMFFQNGEVITGYIAYKPFDPIEIQNIDLLKDGRFNSTNIN